MAGKSASMTRFIAGLLVLSPIGVISGLIGLGWLWEFVTSCFFSLSNYCGQDKSIKAILFLSIAYGCFTGIKALWDKTK